MRTHIPRIVISALVLGIVSADAGELNVTGHLTVASNLTAHAVTLGGETRTNWPSGGGASSGADNLTTAVLDFTQSENLFRYMLTNTTTWVFTNHVEGREIQLKVIQDGTGGWTNNWPSNLLWPGGHTEHVSSHANHFDLFKIVDDGNQWLATVEGSDYRMPCLSNCNYSLQFDGSQNEADASASTDFSPSVFTVECWVNKTASSGVGDQVNTSDIIVNAGSLVDSWILWFGNGVSDFYSRNSSAVVLHVNGGTGFGGIDDGTWHHVAITFDGTNVTAWIDGALDVQTDHTGESLPSGSFPLALGAASAVTLDEVRISSVVRYTSTFTPAHFFSVDSDTVAYYKFNEGSGSTAHDETSNHDATLSGSPDPSWEEGN